MSYTADIIRQNPQQLDLDSLIQATGDAASKELFEAALLEVETVCLVNSTFTVDNVHERLKRAGIEYGNGSFLGQVMRDAKKNKWCVPLQEFVPSERAERHGSPVRKWASLFACNQK